MDNIFFQLAISLTLASLFGLMVLRLKLPLVVAFLLAGVSLSVVSVIDPHHSPVFEILPEIGIAFVLFLIGMELDLREVRKLGVPIIASALGQILISTLAGYSIAHFLGFNTTESIYLGLGLAFSSTVVVIKMLLEKNDLTSLYGKLSIGILLVEDMVAIAALMFISVTSSSLGLGLQESLPVITLILKGIGLFFLTFFLSRYVLERIFDSVAKSVELLFLTAITWCFVFTCLAVFTGFSVVIGAFLAGVALASSPYHLQIQTMVKPLRDFFLTLFFIYLGLQANLGDLLNHWVAVLVFTIFAIVIKPVVYMLILGIFGFRKNTIFKTALNLSQISEFSLVVLLVGVQANIASNEALSVMAAVAIISIIVSSILISKSKIIYRRVSKYVAFFEHKSLVHEFESKLEEELSDHIIIVGANRIGGPVVEYLQKTKIPFVVMDYNPAVVEKLREDNVKVIYGDIGDPDIVENLQIEKAKLILCTATDMGDNENLLDECRRKRVRAKIVVRAVDNLQAKILKDLGADYVILAEQASGDYIATQLKSTWPNVNFSKLD